MIKFQRDPLDQLDETDKSLRTTEEKQAAMQTIVDRARMATRR
ncbi:hypothetical protein A2U01_0069168, partial [Trifolium medium]|nr:hypothetical protein [Trifolium medium]